jgi:hypothetical protein
MVAVVSQRAAENGDPLFQIEFENPDFDNFYLIMPMFSSDRIGRW